MSKCSDKVTFCRMQEIEAVEMGMDEKLKKSSQREFRRKTYKIYGLNRKGKHHLISP